MHSRKSLSPRRAALVLWLAALGTAATAAAADPLQTALNHMDQAATKFKGLSADVVKISHNALLNEDDKFSGTMAVRRGPKPRELRALVDVQQPDRKKVLLTSHHVEMYYPRTNTVQIIDLDRKNSAMVDQFLLLGFGSTSAEIQKAYVVKLGGAETVAGHNSVRLILTPKSPDVLAKLTQVELWMSEMSDTLGIAVQQKFWEPGGDYELATYTNIKLHAALQELKWDIPKDAKKDVLNK